MKDRENMTTDQHFAGAPEDATRERKIEEENGQEFALIAANEVASAYVRMVQEKHQKMQQECAKEMEGALASVAKLDKMERGKGWNLNPHLGFWYRPIAKAETPSDVDNNGVSAGAATGEVVGSIEPKGEADTRSYEERLAASKAEEEQGAGE